MHRSIFFRLTLFFLLVAAAVSTGFYFLLQEARTQHIDAMEKESEHILDQIRYAILMPDAEREAYFRSRGYGYAALTGEAEQGLSPAFEAVPERLDPQIHDAIAEGRIALMRSNAMLYVLINRAEAPFMVGAPLDEGYRQWLLGGFWVMLLLIASLYLSIVHSLLPLRKLARAIRVYGDDGTYLPTQSGKKDEIAYVANAFDEAVRKNRALTEARRLFMRNVMHELKTPITVGKLALPFMPKQGETEILERAFMRMELLLEEMSRVEQVTSQTGRCDCRPCQLSVLVDEAEALMLGAKGEVVREFAADETVLADARMMISVFKNLVDNAFKYSDDKRVLIRRDGDALHFINRGQPWPEGQTLEMMVEPFAFNNPDRAVKSFGLGLYIVKSILDAHRIGFSYFYRDGMHHFVLSPFAPLQP